MSRSTSIRMDEAKLHRLDALAQTMGQSRGKAINSAVDQYIEYHEWFLAAVDKGINDAEEGRIATPEQVQASFQKWGIDLG
jgi:predicted transcriptional regulator